MNPMTDPVWHYVRQGGDAVGPVTALRIQELLSSGELRPTDLAWREGFPEWIRISAIPELQPEPAADPVPPPAAQARAAAASILPAGLAGWMGFVGVMTLLYGVLVCLTCFGIPLGIVLIIAGSALISGRRIAQSLTRVDPEVYPLLEKIRTFVVLIGVMWAIALCLFLISLTGMLGSIIAAITAAAGAR